MKRSTLNLELLDDVVLSTRAASFGGHESLDYIPGAVLLGWAASQLYAELNKEGLAFDAFHSGCLRFGNALPLDPHGAVALPVPHCWSLPKGSSPESAPPHEGRRKRLGLGNIDNELLTGRKQRNRTLREGFVVPDTGEWLKPARTLRMRTAINPKTGRAARGQLFGYQSLIAGQQFRAELHADDTLDPAIFERIRDCFDQATLRLGRSRSAQYGQVSCSIGPMAQPTPRLTTDPSTLTLWLLSDLAALDHSGQPTLTPQLQDLAPGLPPGSLLPEKSFISHRRYSPYNGFRRSYDLERQVIEQGSVLSFSLTDPLNAEHLELLEAGLGAYREMGLGQVLVSPDLLNESKPRWSEPLAPTQAHSYKEPELPLVQWLKNQRKQDTNSALPSLAAERQLIEGLYDSARRLAGAPEGAPIGPGASQWGNVTQAATELRGKEEALLRRLFAEKDGICRNRNAGAWEVKTQFHPPSDAEHVPVMDELDRVSFADWLEYEVRWSIDQGLDPLKRLHTLARAAKSVFNDSSSPRKAGSVETTSSENPA
ncbi:MAG: hypothetical protein ACPG4N_01285 [Gammaproteobacteria bacterium]